MSKCGSCGETMVSIKGGSNLNSCWGICKKRDCDAYDCPQHHKAKDGGSHRKITVHSVTDTGHVPPSVVAAAMPHLNLAEMSSAVVSRLMSHVGASSY